jgi:hypothetical protein
MEEARVHLSSLNSAAQVVLNILDRKEEERSSIVHMLWAWWIARNKQMLESKCHLRWLLLDRLRR